MSSVGCIPHLSSTEPKRLLCGKSLLEEFLICILSVFSVILSISLILFLLLQRFFPTYFISVKLSPPVSQLGHCLYFCLCDLPGVAAVEPVVLWVLPAALGRGSGAMGSFGEAQSSSCLSWEKPAECPVCSGDRQLILCLAWLGMPKSSWAQPLV